MSSLDAYLDSKVLVRDDERGARRERLRGRRPAAVALDLYSTAQYSAVM